MDDANGRVPDHSAADMELDKNTGPVESVLKKGETSERPSIEDGIMAPLYPGEPHPILALKYRDTDNPGNGEGYVDLRNVRRSDARKMLIEQIKKMFPDKKPGWMETAKKILEAPNLRIVEKHYLLPNPFLPRLNGPEEVQDGDANLEAVNFAGVHPGPSSVNKIPKDQAYQPNDDQQAQEPQHHQQQYAVVPQCPIYPPHLPTNDPTSSYYGQPLHYAPIYQDPQIVYAQQPVFLMAPFPNPQDEYQVEVLEETPGSSTVTQAVSVDDIRPKLCKIQRIKMTVPMHNIQPEDRDVQQAPQGEEIQQNAEPDEESQLLLPKQAVYDGPRENEPRPDTVQPNTAMGVPPKKRIRRNKDLQLKTPNPIAEVPVEPAAHGQKTLTGYMQQAETPMAQPDTGNKKSDGSEIQTPRPMIFEPTVKPAAKDAPLTVADQHPVVETKLRNQKPVKKSARKLKHFPIPIEVKIETEDPSKGVEQLNDVPQQSRPGLGQNAALATTDRTKSVAVVQPSMVQVSPTSSAQIEKPRQLEGNQRAKKRARKAKKVVQHTPFLLEVKTEAEEPSECIEGGAQLQQVHPPTQDVPVCAIARSARNIGMTPNDYSRLSDQPSTSRESS